MSDPIKVILNDAKPEYWELDAAHNIAQKAEDLAIRIANEAVDQTMRGASSAYMGIHPTVGSGMILSIFIEEYVLYFKADDLFEHEDADRSEVEAVANWHKEKYEQLTADLKATKKCPYCSNQIPKIHNRTCCESCIEKRWGR